MLPRRLILFVILVLVLAVSGSESHPLEPPKSAQPDTKAQPNPPVGWVKERLEAVDKKIDGEIKDRVALYRHIHENPELSLVEVNTAKRLAEEMRKAGYEGTENGGKKRAGPNVPSPGNFVRSGAAAPLIPEDRPVRRTGSLVRLMDDWNQWNFSS
jgi:hypothetical protein